MKIGIVTYYRSHNYGAMLQAFALRQTLQNTGYEATFIDYWPQHQKNIYRLFAWEDFWRGGIRGRIRYLKTFARTLIPKLMRRKNFNRFYRDQILPYVSSQKEEYDVIVYGSDQIWRKQGWGYGYNPVYFGKNNFKAKKHISYAASMGSLPDNDEDTETVKNLVKHIDRISVRETELQQFLNEQGFKNVEHTIDPTFLLSKEDWKSVISKERIIAEPYLLFYDLQGGAFDSQEVSEFAKTRGLRVIRINGFAPYMPTQEDRTTDGPYEFLNLVFYSDYVVTSSFHGLAFSLIFQKEFLTSLLTNRSRVKSILESLGLSDRLLANHSSLIEVQIKEIDWSFVKRTLDKQRKEAIDFINMIN